MTRAPLPGEPRLAAVLFVDLVRYSELTAADGPRAFRTVQRLQQAAGTVVSEVGGRVVKFTGDGALAEFGSAWAAASAALRLREKFLASQPDGEVTDLRTGLHIGELQSDENGDVYGDGVNVAARLQAEAEAGQVVASEDIWHQLRSRPELEFRSLGERKLKGHRSPVLVFELRERAQSAQDAPAAVGWGAGLRRHARRLTGRRRLSVPGWVPPLVLIGAIFLGFLISSEPTPALAFNERDQILILDCENRTGEAELNGTLNAALTAGLEQSRYVGVYPRERVAETLERMGRERGSPVDERVGSEIAQRTTAPAPPGMSEAESRRPVIRALLGCNVSRIGDGYVLTARLIDPIQLTSVLSLTEHAATPDGVIPALDELVKEVRQRLGESMAQVRTDYLPLPNATTPSLEALRYKVLGDSAWNVGGYEDAANFWRLAVDHDAGFALAHSSLALYHFYNNRRDEGEAHLRAAFAETDRLAARERLWIDAMARANRGDHAGAASTYSLYLANYPADSYAWFNLARAHQALAQCDTAIAVYEKVLELDPDEAGALINIATCHLIMDRPVEAVPNYRRAFAIDPSTITSGYINHEYGNALVKLEQYDSAAAVFTLMLDRELLDQAKGHRSLGLMEMARGRYMAGAEHLRESVRRTQAAGARLSEYRDRLFLAVAYQGSGLQDRALAEIDDAYAIARAERLEPPFLMYGGRLLARAGRLEDADALLRDMGARAYSSPSDRSAYALLEGEIAMARGQHAAAIDALERAHSLQPGNEYYIASLADAYRAAGHADRAIERYRELASRRTTGWEAQDPSFRASYELGRLMEEQGDTARAIEAYQTFADAWADGDSDLPMLVRTRARLAALTGG
ncbi:MAG: tetratricopeptide repeat protein [Longimicrobiales bacterium]